MQVEPRCALEEGVGGEERRSDVDGSGSDPEVVGVDRFV